MKTWRYISLGLVVFVALLGVACAPAPTPVPPAATAALLPPTPLPPTPVPPAATATLLPPTPLPPTPVPPAATATLLPPTTAPTVAAFDMPATLDKYFSNLPDGFGTLAPAALNDQMAMTKLFIVDVREPKEIADNGFVEGSINIPIRTLLKHLDQLPAKDQPIITLCGNGHRGAMAMEALQLLGYTKVKSVVGGFGAWKDAKLPVATGSPVTAVASKAPEVDKDLFAALDKYLGNLPDGFGTLAPNKLSEQLAAAQPFQVDVREPKEIADNGLIAGSINIPVRTLIKNLAKLPQNQSAAIVTECGNGHRGAMTMMALNLLGYSNVKSLAGGFGAWSKAGLLVTKP